MSAGRDGSRSIPTVSIVLPTRNRASLLQRALASIASQSFTDWELIIVDDASTDATPDAISALIARDQRVRTIRTERQQGGAAARNRGIDAAAAEWIAFLDDDDEWLPSKLDEQLRVARATQSVLVYSPCMYVDENGDQFMLRTVDVSQGNARRALLRSNFISTPAVMARRDVLQGIGGFDERLPRLQDWDLWLRLADAGAFSYLGRPLVRAYHTKRSISADPAALTQACAILDAKYSKAAFDRRELADFNHALGHILMIGGAPDRGPYFLWRSVRVRPTPRRFAMALVASAPAWYQGVSRVHERLARGLGSLRPADRP